MAAVKRRWRAIRATNAAGPGISAYFVPHAD